MAATRAVRLGLGHTRYVSMIEGEVEVLEIDALPQERGDRFVAHTGFDPRAPVAPYRWFRVSPRHIQARREVNEMPDGELMRDGRWLVWRLGRARRMAEAQGLHEPKRHGRLGSCAERAPRPASAGQASRHPGRHRRSGGQRTVAATAPTK